MKLSSAGLIAGSHNRNELLVIHCNGESSEGDEHSISEQTCQICGDDVGFTPEGDLFVACNDCAFPVCKICYDYERREGCQACPQCKTRYKRLKGCPRVFGDEDDDDDDEDDDDGMDALENDQLCITDGDTQQNYHHTMNIERIGSPFHLPVEPSSSSLDPNNNGCGNVTSISKPWMKNRQLSLMMNEKEEMYYRDDYGDEAPDLPLLNERRQSLSRKIPVSSSLVNPYRMVIIIRLVIQGLFIHYRLSHPVNDAYALWLVSVMCEIWFAVSWILDQFPKWLPVNRETYLDRLSLRYEKKCEACELSCIDIFVCTANDPAKEPPLIIANTILSILAVDYPAEKVSCYVSDDGASMLTYETLSETARFARKWIPFCKKFGVEPRAPEWYFSEKIDYLEEKVLPAFVKERRAMKREYEEFKVGINGLVAKAQKVPDEGWRMQDGTPWPGNNVHDHPPIVRVLSVGEQDIEGNQLPCFVYVSREKRPAFKHHRKAGAMNALVRVSGILTNAPYLLHLDSDHYVNNSKALREAMCFMMDPLIGKKVCYVQFNLNINRQDPCAAANRNISLDMNMKGQDGIQGPMYVGSGCVFRRVAICSYDAPILTPTPPTRRSCCICWDNRFCCCPEDDVDGRFIDIAPNKTHHFRTDQSCNLYDGESTIYRRAKYDDERSIVLSEHKREDKYGEAPLLNASTFFRDSGALRKSGSLTSLLQEAYNVASCKYENKTDWGKEVGWIYGCATEDILTGFKMHCRGWRSIYCAPVRPAFKYATPIDLFKCLNIASHCALGSVEIFLSKTCPLWYGYGGGLKCLQRLAYVNATLYPLTSIPLVVYCSLPAVCLLTGKFIIAELSNVASIWFISLFMCVFATSLLEMRWSGVSMEEWWRSAQFWVVRGVSADLFAVFGGLVKVVAGVDIISRNIDEEEEDDDDNDDEEKELFKLNSFKCTNATLLVLPTSLVILNVIGIVVGISDAIRNGWETLGLLLGKIVFAGWVIVHLYPFLIGIMRSQTLRTPVVIVVWSMVLASILALMWIRIDPFVAESDDLVLEDCGLNCP
ncbi:probable cellulose synthase A catalytic subunit 6 [UDP-forming] [Andrographis paniculata]|uniref:probable cellulose synthase A catalytic subunit 6 [UDP-forming] n=1 Tax=Andrographis paniculata TaxID=175694 RepID=UPI0021E71485|nr:probable cellulose synthase A catalytic subunit 6 [UDP-forming] [Andrographis paniculata]